MPTKKANPDTAAILAQLREEIRARRAQLSAGGENDPYALSLGELRESVEAVNDTFAYYVGPARRWEARQLH
jgi:acyl-CoA reductase-like NAD-dependent aldehyde dehydrogenase